MIEAEWLTSDDPGAMLAYLAGKYVRGGLGLETGDPPSDRKLRLWVEACRAVVGDPMESVWVDMDEPGMALHSAEVWATMCPGYVKVLPYSARAALLREIVGNPFRPVGLWDDLGRKAMGWLTPVVLAIAQAAYDERDWGRLPILADALEENGCTNADLLSHLRGPGPHVRGCWALDLVLGLD